MKVIYSFANRLCKVSASWKANKAQNKTANKWNYIIWKFQFFFFFYNVP